VDKRKKRARATNRKAKSKSKSVTDSAYHFIAYVPVGRKVWQLDGLKTGPVCIGKRLGLPTPFF
jgi:Ubiquitin carboxyl-terminal hydrolase, family 1.